MAAEVKTRARIYGTIIEAEVKQFLEDNRIAIGKPIMVPKRGKCEPGNIPLTTNVYGVMMKEMDVFRYDITIIGYIPKATGGQTTFEFTTKAKGDSRVVLLRDRCRDVFELFQEKEAGKFFKRRRCAYYDLQSILFSLDPFDVDEFREFDFQTTEFDKKIRENFFGNMENIKIIIRPVVDNFIVRLGDFTTISDNLLLFDRSLLQFLDLATSQYAMFHPYEHVTFSSKSSYLINPGAYFLNSSVNFEDTCSYLAFGAQKGARVIEGPKRGRAASLVVEVKKTAFHAMVNLLEKVSRMIQNTRRLTESDYNKLTTALKGLIVETTHTKRTQRFEIRGLSRQGANAIMILVDNDKISVTDYFKKKYAINLKEPTLPLVETMGRDKKSVYMPIELCYVSDNQRVKMNQQTPSMTKIIIRQCAIPPSVLRGQISTTANFLRLFDSEWLTNAQIKVIEEPINLAARGVTIPELDFQNQRVSVDTRSYTWNGNRFLYGAKCGVWAAYAFIDPHDRLDNRQLEQFLINFVGECRRRGIDIGEPAEWDVRPAKAEIIDEAFKNASMHNCDFIFTVHSDNGDAAHADIKYYERINKVTTQCIRMRTLRDVMEKNRRLTLSNIVNKTNMKLGGLNYSLSQSRISSEILGTQTLYIGIGMNHPAGGLGMKNMDSSEPTDAVVIPTMTSDVPSIVGYAANIGFNNEFDIAGDFTLQVPLRDEKSNVIVEIVQRCLDFYNQRRKRNPERIIIYRNGCSEGAFRMILQYEVPMMKHVLRECGCSAKITIIVVNKLQNIRFFNKDIDPRQKAPEQNVRPGVVIDHTVVHPKFAEFFLSSHRALQGTSRIPKYTVVYDDNEFALEQLEDITFHLCFGHQIVNMPTSLPSPVYIANRYAERGRMLYQRWLEHDKREDVSYHTLSDELCYYTSQKFFGRRINA